jgi:hypothetical protein
MDAGMDFNDEALEALSDLLQQTESELIAACQKWTADLLGGAMQNLNSLLERDKGTAREEMWLRIRAGYEAELPGRGHDGTE